MILDGGIMIATAAPAAVQQIVYLDFDGELTSYNGEILTIDHVAVEDSGLNTEDISAIADKLNEDFADRGVIFVTERPADGEFSTIYIGKTSAFEKYGNFAGLAETIDAENLNKSDNAFVMLKGNESATAIADTIAHEVEHIVFGMTHTGSDLTAYAEDEKNPGYIYYYYSNNHTLSGASNCWIALSHYSSNRIYTGSSYQSDGGDDYHCIASRYDSASDVTIYSSGFMRIYSGGVANRTTINAHGDMYIRGGGVANSTTVNVCGSMFISSGGVANNTILNSGGSMVISSGGVANSTTVNSGGDMYISHGGEASNTTLNSAGVMYIRGGVANDTTVNSGGVVWVSRGGTALEIIENGGYVNILSGAEVSFASNTFSGLVLTCSATVHSGTTAVATTLNSCGSMRIYSGGVANSTTVNSGGRIEINGNFKSGGGVANSTTVNSGGEMVVEDGGVANSTTVNSGGRISILYSGIANSTTVNSGGRISIAYSGIANSTTVNSGGGIEINGNFESGGIANDTMVDCGGFMNISRGGVANNTTVNSGGSMRIFSGGVANSTTLNSGGWMDIRYYYGGGTANHTTVNSGGRMYISSGGVANDIVISSGGYVAYWTQTGEVAATITQMKGSGITGVATNLNGSGTMRISCGGVANSTTVNSGGDLYISSGGVANSTTVNSGGWMHISSGGVANNTTMNSGGSMVIYSGGGILSGTTLLGGEMSCSGTVDATDAEIVFAVDQRTTDDAAIISNLANISGGNYTIQVDPTVSTGIYKLATGASDFTESVTVCTTSQKQSDFVWNENKAEYEELFSQEEDYGFGIYKLEKDGENNLNFIRDKIYIVSFDDDLQEKNGWSMKMAVAEYLPYLSIEYSLPDFKAGWGKKTNHRSWAGIDFEGIKFKVTADEDEVDLTVRGKVTGRVGIFSIEADLTQTGQGLFLQLERDNNGEWSFTDWDLVGKFTATLQQVDHRRKFNLGNLSLDTMKLEGIAEIDTKKNIYTFTGKWKRSAWSTAQLNTVKATMVEVTVNGVNELELDSISLTIEDSVRQRIDPGFHIYYINGTIENLASNHDPVSEPMTFSGALKFTYASLTLTFNNKNTWLKNLFEELKLGNLETVKAALVDVSIKGKVDANGSFSVNGSVDVGKITVNGSSFSIAASSNNLITYNAPSGILYTNGNIRILKTFYLSTSIISTDIYTKVEGKGTFNIPAWCEFFTSVKSLEGSVSYLHTSDKDVITIYGKVSYEDSDEVRILGKYFDLQSGLSFDINNEKTLRAAEQAEFMAYVDAANKTKYKAPEIDLNSPTAKLFIDGVYESSTSYMCVSVENTITGEYFMCSTKGAVTSTVPELYNMRNTPSATLEKLDFNKNGFSLALNNASAGSWVVTCWDSSGKKINGLKVHVSEENTDKDYSIEKFEVVSSNVGNVIFDYSVTAKNPEHTSVYLYRTNTGNTEDGILVAELAVGSNMKYIWAVDSQLESGTWEFYLVVAGENLPVASELSGCYTVAEYTENEPISPVLDETGEKVHLYAFYAAKHEQQKYAFNSQDAGMDYNASLGIILDRSRKVQLIGVGSEADEIERVEYIYASPDDFVKLSTENTDGGLYIEISSDNFMSYIRLDSNKLDVCTQNSIYMWRIVDKDGSVVRESEIVNTEKTAGHADKRLFLSNADGIDDVFFARENGVWRTAYQAVHRGILNDWQGTGDSVGLSGKNKIADIFEGSTDANVLLLTDGENGDALFADDIFSAAQDNLNLTQARIANLDVIRSGAGDDVVDMTSQRFNYIGDGVTIYGGDGDDVIWSNKGDNQLFGDAGNDRIVGASGNDVIVGGAGDDRMHGGGGDDIFCFGSDWGIDTVDQLSGGTVTLWFEDGSDENWNADTRTYSDGENTVTVSGTADVTLKFGGDVSSLPDGIFSNAVTKKIFESTLA